MHWDEIPTNKQYSINSDNQEKVTNMFLLSSNMTISQLDTTTRHFSHLGEFQALPFHQTAKKEN